MQGKSDRSRAHLIFELPDRRKSVKAEWSIPERGQNVGNRSVAGNIPVDVTIDNKKTVELEYRDNKLYEKGQPKPWSGTDLSFLKEAFSKMLQGEIEDSNITTRGLLGWVSCIGDFAGGGAGIGSAVGLFGGPKGVATGAAIGGALGGSFGLGFCTAAEIDKALR